MNHAEGMNRRQLLALVIGGLLAAVALAMSLGPVMSAFAAPSKPAYKAKIALTAPEAAGVNQGVKIQAKNIKMRPIGPRSQADVNKQAGKYGMYGGCTPGYGKGAKCLPPVSPAAAAMHMSAAEMPWQCFQVKALHPTGIALTVKGVDPLALDKNKDGIACGSGD